MGEVIEVDSDENESQFPPGMAPKILNLVQCVDNLEKSLEPLISQPSHEALSKLSSLEKSKIGMLETYTVNSLFWVLMKLSKDEAEPSLHEDFKLEMGRLKEIQNRIAEVEIRAARPSVNTEAASRMIRRGIGKQDNKRRKKVKRTVEDEEKSEPIEDQSYESAWR